MSEQKNKNLYNGTEKLRALVEKAGERGDKTVRFPVNKEMLKELLDVNEAVQNGENNIPDSEKNKFIQMSNIFFEFVGDAMEGVEDWWNKPVRDMADGTPQTRGQKWSRRLSKGFDATVDFASDAGQTVCKAFEDDQIEEIIIEIIIEIVQCFAACYTSFSTVYKQQSTILFFFFKQSTILFSRN